MPAWFKLQCLSVLLVLTHVQGQDIQTSKCGEIPTSFKASCNKGKSYSTDYQQGFTRCVIKKCFTERVKSDSEKFKDLDPFLGGIEPAPWAAVNEGVNFTCR
jgi:hypothetical protein